MNEGIRLSEVGKGEAIKRTRRNTSYVLSAGVRHQVVHGKDKHVSDIAIAFSTNGRENFRCYGEDMVYVRLNGPYLYRAFIPLDNISRVVKFDLSLLI